MRTDGRFVLYWMISARRTRFNFGLQQAADHARELGKPLVVLEALRCDYPWASERFHRFVLDGMEDNAERFRRSGVHYHPYVEPRPKAGKGLLAELAGHACVVVTDDFPAFFLPRMVETAARRCPVRMEAVDSNGLLPISATDRAFPTAYGFRRFLQRELPEHLEAFPKPDPLRRLQLPERSRLPSPIGKRWPRASRFDVPATVDRTVARAGLKGGPKAARALLKRFVDSRLDRYDEDRNLVSSDGTSGLSPYLHFGHVSPHEVCLRVMEREEWTPLCLAEKASGSRSGWWGMSPSAEGFLDQLVTWRELGYNMCRHRKDYDRYESLPGWALETLKEHASDPREHLYSIEELDDTATHDEIWNAAQRQLRREGTIHNYLRMLWGKKILEWSPTSPRGALAINDRAEQQATRWTGSEPQLVLAGSSGCWAGTIAPGVRSGRSSARCAT